MDEWMDGCSNVKVDEEWMYERALMQLNFELKTLYSFNFIIFIFIFLYTSTQMSGQELNWRKYVTLPWTMSFLNELLVVVVFFVLLIRSFSFSVHPVMQWNSHRCHSLKINHYLVTCLDAKKTCWGQNGGEMEAGKIYYYLIVNDRDKNMKCRCVV